MSISVIAGRHPWTVTGDGTALQIVPADDAADDVAPPNPPSRLSSPRRGAWNQCGSGRAIGCDLGQLCGGGAAAQPRIGPSVVAS